MHCLLTKNQKNNFSPHLPDFKQCPTRCSRPSLHTGLAFAAVVYGIFAVFTLWISCFYSSGSLTKCFSSSHPLTKWIPQSLTYAPFSTFFLCSTQSHGHKDWPLSNSLDNFFKFPFLLLNNKIFIQYFYLNVS